MWPPQKLRRKKWHTMCYPSITCSYRVHGVFLPRRTPPPGIHLPCLAGHLTPLSLRLCRHGNSSVTGPGWAWGMSCGVMARFLQPKERRRQQGKTLKQRRAVVLDGKLRGLWHVRSGAALFAPIAALRHIVIVLRSWPQISHPVNCAKESCCVECRLWRASIHNLFHSLTRIARLLWAKQYPD